MLSGCKKYDDTDVRNDIQDLQSRVTALETWCETAKGQISSLQGLVQALESKNFITSVIPVMEGAEEVGYTITFQTGNPITIKHGKDGQNGDPGVTPRIGASKDPENPSDETYYWTVKIGEDEPEFILDEQDNKIPVTGEKGEPGTPGASGSAGHTPVLSVEENGGVLYWKVDGEWLLNGDDKVPATGEKGEPGDAIFQKDGIDYESDPDNVIFTLANGTVLTLPRTRTLTVGFDSYEVFTVTPISNVIGIVLPETLKEEDYTALVAEVKNEAGAGMDIRTRAASLPWQVTLTEPTFVNGEYQNDARVTVAATGANNGDRAILKITLIDGKGQEISASRVLEYSPYVTVQIQGGGLSAALAGVTPADITALRVTGTLNDTDFEYIREELTALEAMDLAGTDMTAFPDRALRFEGDTPNTTLKEVVLPEGLTAIKDAAFANCSALEKLNVPSSVTTLGKWMLENTALSSFTVNEGVTEIPQSCFYGSAVTSLVIPASVTSIGDWAFQQATQLESLVINATVKEIPADICWNDYDGWDDNNHKIPIKDKLTSLTLGEGIEVVGLGAFEPCPITSLTLPSTLVEIKDEAFASAQITELVLPEGFKTFHSGMFRYAPLKTIDIPSSVTTLNGKDDGKTGATKIFNGAVLETFICRAVTPPALPRLSGDSPFTNCGHNQYVNETCVLKVPAESVDAYKASDWNYYFKTIEAID